MKVSLYTIENEYQKIADELMENGGELTPEIELALSINKYQLQGKSAGYAFVIKDKDAEIEAIDKEIERLSKLKQSRVNTKERLKNAIKSAMELYGIEKIESNTIRITLAKSAPSVVIEDESLIPKKYKKTETKTSVLKKEISNDLKAGAKIKGAYLETNNKNIRIS